VPAAPGKFVLVHRHTGRATGGPTVVLLHERYEDLTALDDVAAQLETDHAVLAVRGARTQIRDQFVHGYYWFIEHEPCQPEASTLGDALAQLELGLLEHEADTDGAGFVLVGRGQGATVALLLAVGWPELVRAVVAIDGCDPTLVQAVGPGDGRLDALRVLLLVSSTEDLVDAARTRTRLEKRGARVEARMMTGEGSATAAEIAAWVRATSDGRR